jgi:peptidoglycan/LPS O-acetylase OafA/YrhL
MMTDPQRIPSLDGLRAISVCLVVANHLLWQPDFIAVRSIHKEWFSPLGHFGVQFFFVISGFLITGLLLRELDSTNNINLGKFYFRRTLRIFPPYYCFVLTILMIELIGWIKLAPNDVLHALTYTVNYHAKPSWEIGHAWSLSVEEQFYLVWPAILLVSGKRRGLWIAAVFFFPIAPAIRLAYWYLQPSLIPYQIGYRFETAADAIAIGCLLAGTHMWLQQNARYQRVLKSKLFLLIPLLVLYAVIFMDSHRRRYLLFSIPVQNIGIAACIAWCVTNTSGIIGRMLNAKPVVFLGKMSYSVYLWQQLFLNPHSSVIVTSFPLNLLLVATASLVAHYAVERPSLQMRPWLEARLFARQKRDLILSQRDGGISSVHDEARP